MSAATPTGPITRASKSVDRSFLNYMKFANLMSDSNLTKGADV